MKSKLPFILATVFCCLTAGLACIPWTTKPPVVANTEGTLVGYLWDARFKKHQTGKGHLESAGRLDAIGRAISQAGLERHLKRLTPRICADRWILEVHEEEYLKIVRGTIARGQTMLPTGDTVVSADSLVAATLAAGGLLEACDAVVSGDVVSAFCAVRPPGHHATASRGMGFCIFNNVAVAARYLRLHHGIQRILIVDWDVHHGNGTYAIFKRDPHVFQFHLHQANLYPGTGSSEDHGEGLGKGFTINNPLPAGAGSKEIIPLFDQKLRPAMEVFKPQFILISAGFDSHRDDPLGGLDLTAADYARLTHILCDIAERHSGGRIVSVLEGGYNMTALEESVVAHVQALLQRAERIKANHRLEATLKSAPQP